MAPVILELKGSVAHISLNRPDKLNSFNREMALLLQSILDECRSDAVRAVFITGNGKAFSAGQDLAEVTDPEGPGMARILREHYNPIIQRIRELEKPVIAAVNGVAAGAGANIALCCDVVLAASSAVFIQAFSKIGLVPDSGGTYFLPRLVGFQKASALMMLGDKLGAEEAEKLGMLYKVLPDTDFASTAFAVAETLAAMPTKGLALTKKLLNLSLDSNLFQQLNAEDIRQQEAAQSADFKEGVAAFLEKRKPLFRGK